LLIYYDKKCAENCFNITGVNIALPCVLQIHQR
jgi:hypothetical protein